MTKIALICDQHYGARNDSTAFHDYFKKCNDWFFEALDILGIEHVIGLGDLLDRRKYVNYLTLHRLRKDFIEQLERRGISTYLITGNHDIYYKNTHAVNALQELIGNDCPHIKIYDEPTVINIGGTDIQLLPWITEENSDQSFNAIKNSKAEILMGHLELAGFQMYKGIFEHHGMDKGEFSRFDLVFSGHYHHRSTVGNIHYLGAFAEYTWSDFNDPRGFSILDTETRKIKFHQNPYPIFRATTYDDVKDSDILTTIQNTDYSIYKDCYVKLVCKNKSNPYAFDLMFDAIYKAGPLDISIVESDQSFVDNEEDTEIDAAQDTLSILSEYVRGLTLPVDNRKMESYIAGLYKEAISVETVV